LSLQPESTGQSTPNPSANANEALISETQSNRMRPVGVKAAKQALNQSELMSKKLKLMESSAHDSLKMN
jgi:replication-associated recombination protein RarA